MCARSHYEYYFDSNIDQKSPAPAPARISTTPRLKSCSRPRLELYPDRSLASPVLLLSVPCSFIVCPLSFSCQSYIFFLFVLCPSLVCPISFSFVPCSPLVCPLCFYFSSPLLLLYVPSRSPACPLSLSSMPPLLPLSVPSPSLVCPISFSFVPCSPLVCPLCFYFSSPLLLLYVPSRSPACPLSLSSMPPLLPLSVPSPSLVCPMSFSCQSYVVLLYVPSPSFVCPLSFSCLSLSIQIPRILQLLAIRSYNVPVQGSMSLYNYYHLTNIIAFVLLALRVIQVHILYNISTLFDLLRLNPGIRPLINIRNIKGYMENFSNYTKVLNYNLRDTNKEEKL